MPYDRWEDYKVSKSEIADKSYMRHIGSGQCWEGRGKFQLELLKSFGLKPQHRLLDYGCGPFRAAEHFIPFLNAGRYHGFDVNSDFIDICHHEIQSRGWHGQSPHFYNMAAFDPSTIGLYDFIIAFSVFNHLDWQARKNFVSEIAMARREHRQTVVLSHAWWVDSAFMEFMKTAFAELQYDFRFYFTEHIRLDQKDWYVVFGLSPQMFPFMVIHAGGMDEKTEA